MQNPIIDPQDHRGKFRAEDSNAMTIEFLRARLLSERSISRSARQRTDELEKRVMELEEQLQTVTLQRKMAEKATADVLAILEDQGISDLSQELDLGSDLDIPCESGGSIESSKEGDRYTSLKGRQHESDELYGCREDTSPVSNRSLSWKGRHDSPRSLEKYKTSNMKRQNSFSSISSSPNHHLGKSCRKIRHRQSRPVVEEFKDKPVNNNCQENEFVSTSEGYPKISVGVSNIPGIESKIPEEDESEVKLVNKNRRVDEYGREDMKKALEHQAQLIDRFEAMEKAQRKWEEKFRDNNSATPDSCDPGNHSDMTEDKEESKDQIPYSSKVVASNDLEHKSDPRGVYSSEEIFKSEARDVMPKSYDDTRGYKNQNSTNFRTSNLLGQEKSHSPFNGNQNESSIDYRHQSSEMNHHDSQGRGYSGSKPSFPNDIQDGLHQNDASRNKNDLYALVFREQSQKFNGVLESLKQAKISLQQELNRLPLVESSKAIKASPFVGKSEGRFETPIGFSGLFRLPTDYSDEATPRFGVHHSTDGFGSKFYDNNNRGISGTSDGQLVNNPYYSTTPSLSAYDQSHVTRSLESGPISDSKKSSFDPFSNAGSSPYSGKLTYPSFPINPSYQIVTPQMPFGSELSRPYASRTVGDPLADRFSFQGDHLR